VKEVVASLDFVPVADKERGTVIEALVECDFVKLAERGVVNEVDFVEDALEVVVGEPVTERE